MQNINVNIVPDSYPQTIRYSQGDVGREFKINVVGFTIPTGATVKIQATKPSGFGFSVAGTVTGNAVSFTTTAIMTDEAGRFPAELEITKDSVVIGTANFIMWGEANPHPEGTTDGQQGTIIPELTLLVERVEAAADKILDMEVVANTLPAGSQATYSYDEDLNKATFGIPQGEAGAGAAGVVASAYSASATYKVGDYVIHNSNLYRCTTAITTAEAFTAAHWTQIVLANDVSDLKTDLSGLNKITGIIALDIHKTDFEVGGFNSDGLNDNATARVRTKAYFKVTEGYKYQVNVTCDAPSLTSISFYDEDDFVTPRIGYVGYTQGVLTFSVPYGCKYVRVLVRYQSDAVMSTSSVLSVVSNYYSQSLEEKDRDIRTKDIGFPNDNLFKTEIGGFLTDGLNDEVGSADHYYRLRTIDYIPVYAGKTYKLSVAENQSMLYSISYYSTNDYETARVSVKNWFNDNWEFTVPDGCDYIRILAKRVDQSATNITDFALIGIELTETILDRLAEIEKSLLISNNYVLSADLMKRPIFVDYVGALTYLQAFCRYDGKYYSINGTNISEQNASFTELRSATLNTGHGNALQLGNSKYAYASGWDNQKVYKVDLENLTLADTITLPTTGYTTCAVDELRGLIYIFQRDSYPDTEANYNFIVYNYVNEEIKSTKQILAFSAMQSVDLFDDKLFVLNGLGGSTTPNGYRVFDLNGNILAEYFFGDFSSIEPEGVCIDRDTHDLYISYVNRNVYKVSA